jgi:hypothetical protein
MDLQTMGKKVRQRWYTTKKQFSDDLYLIWENCLTYNSDPVCGELPPSLETSLDNLYLVPHRTIFSDDLPEI